MGSKKNTKSHDEYGHAEAKEADREEIKYEDTKLSHREQYNPLNDIEDKVEDIPQDLLAAAGLEESDAEENAVTLSLSPPTPLYIYIYIHIHIHLSVSACQIMHITQNLQWHFCSFAYLC